MYSLFGDQFSNSHNLYSWWSADAVKIDVGHSWDQINNKGLQLSKRHVHLLDHLWWMNTYCLTNKKAARIRKSSVQVLDKHRTVNTVEKNGQKRALTGRRNNFEQFWTIFRDLSKDDDNGSENVGKKMNLRSFKLSRVYLDPLNMSNAGDFS